MITLHATIHDKRITLLPNALLCNFMISPIRETPHGAVNFPKFGMTAGIVPDGVFELLVEVCIIQENIRIIVPAIEMPFDRLDRLDYSFDFLIPSQNDKCSICPRCSIVDMKAAGSKDFVMFFAYFST